MNIGEGVCTSIIYTISQGMLSVYVHIDNWSMATMLLIIFHILSVLYFFLSPPHPTFVFFLFSVDNISMATIQQEIISSLGIICLVTFVVMILLRPHLSNIFSQVFIVTVVTVTVDIVICIL